MYKNIASKLNSLASAQRAKTSAWFFKTGEGEYGQGDIFIGISVPVMRKAAREFRDLGFEEITWLLQSNIHEYRFVALEILVMQYETGLRHAEAGSGLAKAGDEKAQKRIFDFYIKNIDRVNNWDLVDTSAPYIVGHYLFSRNKAILYKLAKSKVIWRRRVAIVATQYFISQGKFEDTLALAELLLADTHDLIHKAVGWMLREVGKRSPETLTKFLDKQYLIMPRTMLRYAIERLPAEQKAYYLKKSKLQ